MNILKQPPDKMISKADRAWQAFEFYLSKSKSSSKIEDVKLEGIL
jgi:hypothetical protein